MKKFAALLMILSVCMISATGCGKKTKTKTGEKTKTTKTT